MLKWLKGGSQSASFVAQGLLSRKFAAKKLHFLSGIRAEFGSTVGRRTDGKSLEVRILHNRKAYTTVKASSYIA